MQGTVTTPGAEGGEQERSLETPEIPTRYLRGEGVAAAEHSARDARLACLSEEGEPGERLLAAEPCELPPLVNTAGTSQHTGTLALCRKQTGIRRVLLLLQAFHCPPTGKKNEISQSVVHYR